MFSSLLSSSYTVTLFSISPMTLGFTLGFLAAKKADISREKEYLTILVLIRLVQDLMLVRPFDNPESASACQPLSRWPLRDLLILFSWPFCVSLFDCSPFASAPAHSPSQDVASTTDIFHSAALPKVRSIPTRGGRKSHGSLRASGRMQSPHGLMLEPSTTRAAIR